MFSVLYTGKPYKIVKKSQLSEQKLEKKFLDQNVWGANVSICDEKLPILQKNLRKIFFFWN